MPTKGAGRTRGTVMIALIAAAVVAVTVGVAAAVTFTGGGHKNASLASASLSQRPTAPGSLARASASYTAVADVTPPLAATSCAAPSTFTYSGTLSATAPGTVRYQWVYSAGQPGPVQTARFLAAGQEAVTGKSVVTSAAGGGWGEIRVLSPVASTSGHAAYKLLCGGTSAGGVTATAAVTPASATASCAPAVPSFTVGGQVTAAKAEDVTYYWALSSGRDSAPATLAFTAPGTRKAAPLTITPPAATGAGEAVLVVTSPVTAASAPAKYSLTCTAPASPPAASLPATSPGAPASGAGATSRPAAPGSAPATQAGNQPGSQQGPSSGGPSSQGPSYQPNPSYPASAPASSSAPAPPPSQPASSGNSGSGSMFIPEIDTLSDTIKVGYLVSSGTQVDGGVAPYTWSMTGLPPGLHQMAQGTGSTSFSAIIGTAEVAGTYPFTVTVTDSEQPPQTLVVHFKLVILPPNTEVWGVIAPALLSGTVGVPFSTYFAATNGVTATFAVSSGAPPPGISLNPATGVLSGTPTQRGIFNFSVIATNVATGGVKLAGTYNFSVSP